MKPVQSGQRMLTEGDWALDHQFLLLCIDEVAIKNIAKFMFGTHT
jgi:hypothetical protein